MKVTTAGSESKRAQATPAPARIVRLILVAMGGFALLMLLVMMSQPERLQRAVVSLESRWGNDFYTYDRSMAEKWSIAIGSYLRDATDDIAEVPELVIDVPFKNMTKIYAKREEALRIGNLIQGPDDFVKGEIRFQDRTLPIKLRLKGDWNDHLAGRKWSFRVHVRNGDQLLGMRKFSLQSPATRGFQTELLFFDVMHRFGVMAPRYSFVNVTLNGDSMGLMALEEFFAKEMVEHNRRREGVILRFDESLVWRAKDSLAGESVGWYGAFDHFSNAAIDGIGSGAIAESPTLSAQYEVAVGLLRAFVDGELPASEVFDVQLLGRYLAVTDMFGAWHAARWPNVRFYFNPVTLRLEPIAYDANLQKTWTDERSITNDEPLVAAWGADPEVAAVYRETLVELQTLVNSGELESQLREVEAIPLRVLQTEYRMLGPMALGYLEPRTALLLKRLNANQGMPGDYITWEGETRPYPLLAHLVRYAQGGRELLEISNAVPKDVEIIALDWVDAGGETRSRILDDQFPLQLPPRGIGSQAAKRVLELPDSIRNSEGYLEAMVRIERRPWYKPQRVQQSYAPRAGSPIPTSSVTEQLEAHQFLAADISNRQLTIEPGEWLLEQSLIVPRGYRLKIDAGTQLGFVPGAVLISHGPVAMNGTASAPVELRAATDAGWPGMVVMQAGGESTLEHVIVRDTTSVVLKDWTLTGGVNFYASDVVLIDCAFFDSRGEDALNIIQSNFRIQNTEIRGTVSDAFDADFASGTIDGGAFVDIGKAGGGDAIDVSGSQIKVTGTRFENVSDKALSIGERSSMQASLVIIKSAGTGAAAKDGSQLKLVDSVIDGARFAGLTAYIKKPEYGPARIEAQGVRIVAAETPVLVQTGNVIEIDGVAAEASDIDVDALYDTIMKPGLRK